VQDFKEQTKQMALAWQHIASISYEIANARRTLFNAYLSEGFTEAQALELIKNP